MSNRGEERPFMSGEDISSYAVATERYMRSSAELYDAVALAASGDQDAQAKIPELSVACKRGFERFVEQVFRDMPEHEAIQEVISLFLHSEIERCNLFNTLAPGSVAPAEKADVEQAIATIMLSPQPDPIKLSTLSILYSTALDADIGDLIRVMGANRQLAVLTDVCDHAFCKHGTRREYCTRMASDDFYAAICGFDTVIGLGDLARGGYDYYHDGYIRGFTRTFDFLQLGDISEHNRFRLLTQCVIHHEYDTTDGTNTYQLMMTFGARNSLPEDSTAHTVVYEIIHSPEGVTGYLAEPILSTEQFKTIYSSDHSWRQMSRYDLIQLYMALESVEQHLLAEQATAVS